MLSQAALTTIYWLLAAAVAILVAVRLVKRLRGRPRRPARRPAVAETRPVTTARTATPPAPVASETAAGSHTATNGHVNGHVSWSGRRLFGHEGQTEASVVPAVDPDEVPASDTSDYVIGGLTPAVASLLPESDERRRRWKKDLRTAGYLSPRAFQNFAALRYLLIIVPMIALGIAMVFVPPRWELYVAIALVAVPLLGWALPALHIRGRIINRVARIERGMPDLVDMLNMCVSQGLTVLASLRRIRRQMADPHPDLATELGIVIEQAEIGTLRQALENFAARIDVPEVHSLVNLLVQTDRMGTSVSAALRDYSDGVRESLRQRADEKANRASFRLLFPTVLCLMPAVYLILLGPAVNELNRFFNSEDGGRSLILQGQQAVRQIDQ